MAAAQRLADGVLGIEELQRRGLGGVDPKEPALPVLEVEQVEIDARRNSAGDIVASSLEIEDDDLGVAIEGPLDAADETSVSVLGVGFAIIVLPSLGFLDCLFGSVINQ